MRGANPILPGNRVAGRSEFSWGANPILVLSHSRRNVLQDSGLLCLLGVEKVQIRDGRGQHQFNLNLKTRYKERNAFVLIVLHTNRSFRSLRMTMSSNTNGTATSFCVAGGGTWPAVQALVVFLTTNIFAHAATIRVPPGSHPLAITRLVVQVILQPVVGGRLAFHTIGRWLSRM